MIPEKKMGERYSSKSEKMKHEKRERGNPKEMMKEYGKKVTSKVKSVKGKVSGVVSKLKPKKTTKVVSKFTSPKAPTNLMAANGRRAVN